MSTSDQGPVASPGDPAAVAPSEANPYRAPQVAGDEAVAPPADDDFNPFLHFHRYRPARTALYVMAAPAILWALLQGYGAYLGLVQAENVRQALASSNPSDSPLSDMEIFERASGKRESIRATATKAEQMKTPAKWVFVLYIVCYLAFVWRCNRNAHALGGFNMEFSPLSAVLWHFAPLANLIIPYRVMAEAWSAADPTAVPSLPENWRSRGGSKLILIWGSLLPIVFVLYGVARYLMRQNDAAAAVRGLQFSAASEALSGVFSLLMIVVGQMVVRRQAARWRALAEHWVGLLVDKPSL